MFRAPLLQRQRITPGVLALPRPASPLRWLSMLCSRAGHSLSRTHAVGSRARIRRRLLFACLALAALLLWSLLYSLAPRRYPPVLAGVKRLQLPAGLPEAPSRGTVEVVVSRYRDDLDWLPALAQLLRANVTVYCKESSAPPPSTPCAQTLPNVGNEGHSYLHHLVERYDSLAAVTLFLPDTLWNDDTLQKVHYTHDVVVAILRARGALAFADMHVPDTRLRSAHGWLKEVFYGFKFPCADRNRGGADCRWDGTSGANPAAGALAAAEPSDFYEWMGIHTETTRTDMLRCGWSFRGLFAVSQASVRKHPRAFYANLRAELGKHRFPMAGMYMERLWRRVFLCAQPTS